MLAAVLGPPDSLMPTPRSTVLEDGPARLYRFGVTPARGGAAPVLLVPSMINRWYVFDLRPGASVVEALVRAGLDVWCLDWGAPEDHDRWFGWADAVDRIERMLRRIKRVTGRGRVSVLGYCMGATIGSVHAALHPEHYAGFVNLLGPIDFSHAGALGTMVDARWFDASAVAAAGNVAPLQMQGGFQALRPTQNMAKWATVVERALEATFQDAFMALETWANDNVAFPAAAYETYITELYQQNLLVQGRHAVRGQRVDLGAITCPVLTITAERDTICPPAAARALTERVGASDKETLSIPGGHVGAVVGGKAAERLYPGLTAWLSEKT